MHLVSVQIDGGPLQRQHLASPHPGLSEKPDGVGQFWVAFLRPCQRHTDGVGLRRDRFRTIRPRPRGVLARVRINQPAFTGELQRRRQHRRTTTHPQLVAPLVRIAPYISSISRHVGLCSCVAPNVRPSNSTVAHIVFAADRLVNNDRGANSIVPPIGSLQIQIQRRSHRPRRRTTRRRTPLLRRHLQTGECRFRIFTGSRHLPAHPPAAARHLVTPNLNINPLHTLANKEDPTGPLRP